MCKCGSVRPIFISVQHYKCISGPGRPATVLSTDILLPATDHADSPWQDSGAPEARRLQTD